jgi:hypothetical protein
VWRSPVARFVRDEEVVGSNPATPTRKEKASPWLVFSFRGGVREFPQEIPPPRQRKGLPAYRRPGAFLCFEAVLDLRSGVTSAPTLLSHGLIGSFSLLAMISTAAEKVDYNEYIVYNFSETLVFNVC